MTGLLDAALIDGDAAPELGALAELCSLPRIGPARLRALLRDRSALDAIEDLRCGNAETLAALSACRGMDQVLAATWQQRASAAIAEAARSGRHVGADLLEAHARQSVWLHLPSRGRAAELWETDPEPPAVLFGQGAPVDLSLRRVGIVGTRRCSAYGRTVARLLGEGLAAEGVAVVSGLATGIDGIAQRAALDEGGPVIGVVGSGLDCVYPTANRALWADVGEHGTLLSEYPLGTHPAPWQFPARNRIVAALCELLIVVESGPAGGSMYTVEAAVERDRTVMAVPGPITSNASSGTNRLLADGCAPVCSVDDVLLALGATGGGAAAATIARPPDDPLERELLDELTAGGRSVDELALCVDAPLGDLATALGRLQLSGWVSETGGWWEKSR
ncbi:DNA-processing protein DprA [Candidatus Poriferisodalis sp.]|uniref:DNA-processing protein DprA n=1 Tax=Candidatus Poriferisodalis sp. TaxID=3101277 RepID=UPI003B020295